LQPSDLEGAKIGFGMRLIWAGPALALFACGAFETREADPPGPWLADPIGRLGDESSRVRDDAEAELIRRGAAAEEGALRAAAREARDPEVRARAARVPAPDRLSRLDPSAALAAQDS